MAEPIDIGEAACGMISVRTDPENAALAPSLQHIMGCAVPGIRRVGGQGMSQALWFSSDELLLLTAPGQAGQIAAALSDRLAGTHHLIQDMSAARIRFAIEGTGARDVLAKGAPVDLSLAAFEPGDLRRTRLGQVAVAFWCVAPARFDLVCFRSVAGYVRQWLDQAARMGPVGAFA